MPAKPACPANVHVFVRGVISMAVLAFTAWRLEGLHILRTDKLRSHAVRSLSGTASMVCWLPALTSSLGVLMALGADS